MLRDYSKSIESCWELRYLAKILRAETQIYKLNFHDAINLTSHPLMFTLYTEQLICPCKVATTSLQRNLTKSQYLKSVFLDFIEVLFKIQKLLLHPKQQK